MVFRKRCEAFTSHHIFPGGEVNNSGWADWCGSSFAAPIISALGAHLFAQGWSAQQAMTRIVFHRGRGSSQLFGAHSDAPALLANLVRVQQQFFITSPGCAQ
jgi:hypothetical protein